MLIMSDNGRPKDGVLDDSFLRDNCPIGAVAAARSMSRVRGSRPVDKVVSAISRLQAMRAIHAKMACHCGTCLPVECYITEIGRRRDVPMLGWKVDCQTSSKHANRGPRSTFIARHFDQHGRALR